MRGMCECAWVAFKKWDFHFMSNWLDGAYCPHASAGRRHHAGLSSVPTWTMAALVILFKEQLKLDYILYYHAHPWHTFLPGPWSSFIDINPNLHGRSERHCVKYSWPQSPCFWVSTSLTLFSPHLCNNCITCVIATITYLTSITYLRFHNFCGDYKSPLSPASK